MGAMENPSPLPEQEPSYILVIREVFRSRGGLTEAQLAGRLGLPVATVERTLEPLAGLVSYPDGRAPWPAPGRRGDTEETFVALCLDRLRRSKNFGRLEAGAWDASLPRNLTWSDDDISRVFSLWREGSTPAKALQMARLLGRRYSSVCWYLGQFDFCDGHGSVWNVQDRAARIFARGDESAYAGVMARVAEFADKPKKTNQK